MQGLAFLIRWKDTFLSLVPLARGALDEFREWETIPRLAVQGGALALIILFFSYFNGIRPPSEFPAGAVVTVPPGESLAGVAERLESSSVIPSALFFRALLWATGFDSKVIAGDYVFADERTALGVAHALVTGDFGLTPVRVTIPEGATSYEIAQILEEKLGTDQAAFLSVAENSEGYLFPDTYFFLPGIKPETVVRTMQDTFFEKVKAYEEDLRASDQTLHEIVTMASLLEKEAYTLAQREQIAAILWRRLDINMPLQVDAVFGYIYKRPTFHPRYSHLAVDSPYNTYKHKGLPPGPIANPGLVSIEAALNPADNDYLYYLSDKEGNLHYSKKFEEHVYKKNLYIN